MKGKERKERKKEKKSRIPDLLASPWFLSIHLIARSVIWEPLFGKATLRVLTFGISLAIAKTRPKPDEEYLPKAGQHQKTGAYKSLCSIHFCLLFINFYYGLNLIQNRVLTFSANLKNREKSEKCQKLILISRKIYKISKSSRKFFMYMIINQIYRSHNLKT